MDDLTNEQMHALLDAWEAWDTHPGDSVRAGRLEDELRNAGAVFGLTATQLRVQLLDHLRVKGSRPAALTAFRRGHAASAR